MNIYSTPPSAMGATGDRMIQTVWPYLAVMLLAAGAVPDAGAAHAGACSRSCRRSSWSICSSPRLAVVRAVDVDAEIQAAQKTADRAAAAGAAVPADGQLRPARDLRARAARARGVLHARRSACSSPSSSRICCSATCCPRRRLEDARGAQRQLGRRLGEPGRGQAGDRHVGNALALALLTDALCYSMWVVVLFSVGAPRAGLQSLDARASRAPTSRVAAARAERPDHARRACCCGSASRCWRGACRAALARVLPDIEHAQRDLLDDHDRDGRRPGRRAHAARALSRRRRDRQRAARSSSSRCSPRRAISKASPRRRCTCCAALSHPRDPRGAAGAGRASCSVSTCTCAASRRSRISAAWPRRRCSPRRIRRSWCPVGVLLALLGYILGTGFGLVMARVLSSLAP